MVLAKPQNAGITINGESLAEFNYCTTGGVGVVNGVNYDQLTCPMPEGVHSVSSDKPFGLTVATKMLVPMDTLAALTSRSSTQSSSLLTNTTATISTRLSFVEIVVHQEGLSPKRRQLWDGSQFSDFFLRVIDTGYRLCRIRASHRALEFAHSQNREDQTLQGHHCHCPG
jgi:hypothetical protein